jgi:Domain of unknown function (DUF3330).
MVKGEVCFKEIPRSEAKSPEAQQDYLIYFCGLDCYSMQAPFFALVAVRRRNLSSLIEQTCERINLHRDSLRPDRKMNLEAVLKTAALGKFPLLAGCKPCRLQALFYLRSRRF